jgi:molybdopterin adenylyltransferase
MPSPAMRVAIITISDSSASGARPNLGGPTMKERCLNLGWQIVSEAVLPDERAQISEKLKQLADSGTLDLILTTGLAEMMRERGCQSTPRAALSRAVAGTRGNTLIVNLPGSPKGAVQSLNAIADLLPHASEVMRGARHD